MVDEKNIYDFYYDKVENGTPSKLELLEMCSTITTIPTWKVGLNKHTSYDLYLKMSEAQNVDDAVIRQLVIMNLTKYDIVDQVNLTYIILDNGSKQLFNDIWENGIVKGMPYQFWKCKFASNEQLTEIYQILCRNAPSFRSGMQRIGNQNN